jgi:hypothetical protein
MLLTGNIHTHQFRHGVFLLTFSALTLLMARVGTDHAHYAFAANNATILADATNRTTYFHVFTLLSVVEQYVILPKRGCVDKW